MPTLTIGIDRLDCSGRRSPFKPAEIVCHLSNCLGGAGLLGLTANMNSPKPVPPDAGTLVKTRHSTVKVHSKFPLNLLHDLPRASESSRVDATGCHYEAQLAQNHPETFPSTFRYLPAPSPRRVTISREPRNDPFPWHCWGSAYLRLML
jgi:hypothetical protein